MSFELAGSPRNKTRSEKHKNSTWNIWWERQEILSQAMALRRTSHLFGKQNYPILTSRTYDSKMVPTFDHRLLCFMWPPLDPPPCYFMYIFGSYRSFVLVARFVLFRSFCFGHFGGFACFVLFCCIISSSWLPERKPPAKKAKDFRQTRS